MPHICPLLPPVDVARSVPTLRLFTRCLLFAALLISRGKRDSADAGAMRLPQSAQNFKYDGAFHRDRSPLQRPGWGPAMGRGVRFVR